MGHPRNKCKEAAAAKFMNDVYIRIIKIFVRCFSREESNVAQKARAFAGRGRSTGRHEVTHRTLTWLKDTMEL
eukprot:1870299-Pyramimonas_sp.AAC.1